MKASVGTTVEKDEIAKEAVTEDKLGPEAVTAAKVKLSEVATLNAGSVAFAGKVSFNGASPPSKAADIGESATNLTISLLTEVAAHINADRKKLNEIRTCLRNHGLMS
jgi:hypothetical protein